MSRTRQPLSSTPQPGTTTQTRESSTARTPGTLRLRGEDIEGNATREPSPGRHIRWSEGVIDNEGMGKKSSKGECGSLYIREKLSLTIVSVLYLPQVQTCG